MAIQTNFPAIKPSLNLDFANTKMLDSRVTFTRASTGTYYNGVTTAKAEENLLLRSQDYSATWTVTSLTPVTGKTAPDSTSTATEFTATAANAVLTQGYTAIAGSYTFSVWLRRVTGTGDIQIAADNGTWTTKVITGTWARYDVTQTVAAGSKTAGVRVVTNTDAIEVWGAQLEQRAAMTAYTATTTQPITNYIPVLLTAQSGVPRFDYNPTTGAALGLLIEESRTNLLTYSEQFDNAAWPQTGASVTANTIVAPDGTVTGDSLIEDATLNAHRVRQIISVTSGVTYTISVFAKASTRTFLQLFFNSTEFGGNAFANFNLSTGALGTVGSASTAVITSVGNGWYRCSVSAAATATGAASAGLIQIVTSGTAARNENYTGDGYSGLFVWGAQFEAGSFATSYIQTVASQVTRAADAASMTGTNFSSWYNAGQGTVFAEWDFAGYSSFNPVIDIGTDQSNILTTSVNSSVVPRFNVVSGGATQANLTLGSAASSNTTYKQVGAYKENDFAASLNGGTVVTDTSGTVPAATQVTLGGTIGLTRALNGHLRRIAYYPLRLTNAQLQALTS